MQVNIISAMTEDGEPVNGLIVVFTIQDINDLVEQFVDGADVIDLPSVDLTALLEGTNTDGIVSHLRFVAARDLETFQEAMEQELDDAGDGDFEYEEHGAAPAEGIREGWKSPLVEDLSAELDLLDGPEGFDFFKNGGLK